MLKKEIKRRDVKMMECLCDVETGVTMWMLNKLLLVVRNGLIWLRVG